MQSIALNRRTHKQRPSEFGGLCLYFERAESQSFFFWKIRLLFIERIIVFYSEDSSVDSTVCPKLWAVGRGTGMQMRWPI